MDEIVAARAEDRFAVVRAEDERVEIGDADFVTVGQTDDLDPVEGVEPVLHRHPVADEHAFGPELDNQVFAVARLVNLEVFERNAYTQDERVLAARGDPAAADLGTAAAPVVEAATGAKQAAVECRGDPRDQVVARQCIVVGLLDDRAQRDAALISDRVGLIAGAQDVLVVAASSVEQIARAATASEDIVAVAALDHVGAIAALEPVRPLAPDQQVVARTSVEVVAVAAQRARALPARVEHVVVVAAEQPVVEPASIKRIVACAAEDVVAQVRGVDRIVAVAGIDGGGDVDRQHPPVGGRELHRRCGPRARTTDRKHRGPRSFIGDDAVDPG